MMHREEKVTELPQLLRCERCKRYVSRVEIVYRRVLPGKCKCGGELKLIEKSVKK